MKDVKEYPPVQFEEILGNEKVIEDLKRGVQKRSLIGSYLFFGPKGVGKYTVAKKLARLIICSGVKDETCQCDSCIQFPDSPDFKEIGLPSDKNTIGVDEISSFRDFLSLYPFQGERRVILVDDADTLTVTAANDLLKIIEELSEHNVVLFVSSKPNKLLPTLKSRLSRVQFRHLGTEGTLAILKKRGMGSSNLKDLGSIAPKLSKSLLTDADKYLSQQMEAFNFIKNFSKKKEIEVLSKIDEYHDRNDLFHFVEMLVVVLTDLLKLHYDSIGFVSNTSRIEVYEELYKTWTTDLLFLTIDGLKKILVEQDRGVSAGIPRRVKIILSMTYLRSQILK